MGDAVELLSFDGMRDQQLGDDALASQHGRKRGRETTWRSNYETARNRLCVCFKVLRENNGLDIGGEGGVTLVWEGRRQAQ